MLIIIVSKITVHLKYAHEDIVKSLTSKQSQIYNFIAERQVRNGYPPTQAEIREHFKFGSLNAVRSHLMLIEKKGYVHLDCGKARGIQIVRPPKPLFGDQETSIPLLGRIAAGTPIWAEENFDEPLPIPPSMFGNGELFALRVIGNSMTEAGIRNGDIAVVRKQPHVENGEIAAVLIEQEATLKRVYVTDDFLVLKAENPTFKTLKYAKELLGSICILGRYQGIVRTENNRGYS